MCIVMIGTAPLAALCNHLAMGAVPADKASSGASVFQTTVELALGLGIATLATLRDRGLPQRSAGRPRGFATGHRRRRPGGYRSRGRRRRQLPVAQAGDLVAAARDAFTSGLHVVGVVSAVGYAGLAVLALRAFRPVRTIDGGDDAAASKDEIDAPASKV